MAVVDVQKAWSLKAATVSDTGSTATEGWTVYVDDATTGEFDALHASQLPPIGGQYEPNGFLLVKRKRAKPLGPLVYEVTVEYASITTEPGDDPLDLEPTYTFSGERSTEAVDVDVNGFPIQNTAGEPFDPPIQLEVFDRTLRIERNQLHATPGTLLNWVDTVNADRFFGSMPGQARMIAIEATFVSESDLSYWQVAFNIKFRRGLDPYGPNGEFGGPARAWYRRVLNAGSRRFVGLKPHPDGLGCNVRSWEPFTDTSGNVISKPVLLDADGKQLCDADSPLWLEFQTYRFMPFAPLSLEP